MGPLLFVLFINDLPERFVNGCKLYADDSKIISIIRDTANAHSLQLDINSLTVWCSDWLMRLNTAKCKIVHFGRLERHNEYSMLDLATNSRVLLEVSLCERDLGIHISSDLKWKTHIDSIASKANRVLGMLKKTFTSRDALLWKMLYVSLVRPHLEFAAPIWNSHTKGDIKTF